MTAEECMEFVKNDLMDDHLPVAKIADKYFNCATSELRDSLIAQLEELKRLYNYKRIIND